MPFVRWQSGSALRCPAPASPVREAALGELDGAAWGTLGLLRESFEGQQDLLGPSLGTEQHSEGFPFSFDANFPDVATEVTSEAETFPRDLIHRRYHFGGFSCS
jgi:hypothetical protein